MVHRYSPCCKKSKAAKVRFHNLMFDLHILFCCLSSEFYALVVHACKAEFVGCFVAASVARQPGMLLYATADKSLHLLHSYLYNRQGPQWLCRCKSRLD